MSECAEHQKNTKGVGAHFGNMQFPESAEVFNLLEDISENENRSHL